MYIRKNFTIIGLLRFTLWPTIYLAIWVNMVFGFHVIFHDNWIRIPWLPISVIGTAVAFYIGFKNNQSYDRLWEARKIWGAIVNSSRAWGSMVNAYISNQFTQQNIKPNELQNFKKVLIYRHIAWLYSLRSQLLIPTPWEHVSQGGYKKKAAEKRMKTFGIGLIDDHNTEEILQKYLINCNYEKIINYKNTATQIIDFQAQELVKLRALDIIEDFRQIELQKVLNDLYIHQGKAERIKKFPLPRQYGNASHVFTNIFLFLLPFGMLTEFHNLGEASAWLSIPFSLLVGWVFILMEQVGDYSENPFEGLGNDIPMLALCRTIEIDLLEMLDEEEIPNSIKAVNGVLM